MSKLHAALQTALHKDDTVSRQIAPGALISNLEKHRGGEGCAG